jgi:ABC-type glycerol-3-phosphate transport system substrate-binding protein
VKRLALVAVAAAALAGCGGSGSKSTSTSTTSTTTSAAGPAAAMQALIAKQPALAGTVKVLFDTGDWAVVQTTRGTTAHAVVFRNANGTWAPDQAGKVNVDILGPQPDATAPKLPQVAIGVTSKLPFVDSGLWVDGAELAEKGGGTATRGTIYGAPAKALKPGTHVAVGYARNIVNGTAVAWVFKTP